MERTFSKIPDLDLIILENLNDKDLLNACKINKYTYNLCKNENFWLKRLRKNYPFLEKYKSENRTWKNIYVSYVYYLNLAEEEKTIFRHFPSLEILTARYAAKNGDLDIVKYFIQNGVYADVLLHDAAQGGNKNIVDFLILKGGSMWDWGLYGAAEGGHLDLVKFFANKPGRKIFWNEVLEYAAKGGNKDIIKFVYDQRGRDINSALKFAKDEETRNYLQTLRRKK